jgi:hypothetical protein
MCAAARELAWAQVVAAAVRARFAAGTDLVSHLLATACPAATGQAFRFAIPVSNHS